MSILIADSGSTKAEWCLAGEGEHRNFETDGLNPYYHTAQSISDVLVHNLAKEIDSAAVETVWFYGAGCDGEDKNKTVEQALRSIFGNAAIHVHSDLTAAARACFFREAGIACILGTGSNSCLYDGEAVLEQIPSLGFILGDEGSAGWFGRKLINSYFRRELPDDLKSLLEEEHEMSLDRIMKGAYGGAQKSRFVASYASFLGRHNEHPFIRNMLEEGFEDFISRVVMKYTDATNREVRFIGSVAFEHQELIRDILNRHGMKPGLFFRKPMPRLVEYHTKEDL